MCDTCGYENTCAHENRTEQESTRDWTYTPSGAEGHITSYYTDIYDVCPDCGESWLKTEATQPTTELNRHGFVDGVCNACGYVNTCTHANQNSGTFMIVESYGDPTASGHSMFGYRVYYYSCPDCGEYREEREEELSSEFVSHSFNSNSICLQCNWECEHAYIDSGYCQYCYKACEHSYDTYEATSSRTQHYAICSTCGNRTMQDHSFEEGICTLCGFDCHLSDGCLNAHLVSCRDYTVCLRSGSMVEDELMTVHHGPDTENRFEETHGYDGYMHWSICQGCSEEIEIDAHSFDENGCCTGCSLEVYADGCHGVHVVGCAAPNVCLCTGEAVQAGEIVDVHHGATSDSDYDWTGSYRITPQRHYWIETCAGCGGERLGDFCSHTLRCTDRTCVSCGYVAPELQGAIEHEYADYQSNATLHWQVCTLCGEATERFPHSGSNGVCNVCGEEFVAQQCNHEVWCGENVCWYCGETVTLDDTVRIRHESDCVVLDDERHAQKCWNCGILYDIDCHGNPDDWMGNEVTHINDEGHGFVCACGIYWFAPHVFVDGCCFECNYVPGDGERHVYDNIYGPTYVDDEGHWKYCEYCGEKVWEAHSFYRGVCKGCDYRLNACAHENRYAMYDIYHWEDRSNYQPVNERYHMLTGTPVLDIWCYDCDALISASEWPTERRLEPHGFKNGVCYWCGYEQAQCAHSETETIPHYDYESYEVEWRLIGSDAQGHHYVADYIEDEVCVRCGEVLSSTKNGTIERLEPHRVSDADATQCLCGDIYDEDGNWIEDCVWPITCTHEHTEIVEKREESIRYASGMDGAMYMGAFFPLDENSHELHMDLEYAEVCQDCGLEIRRSDLTKLDEVVTLPHNFYRGICLNCGYHKLAITKQPESVKVAEGALANVKVTASGEGLKYAWWIAAAGSTSFSKSSVTAASYSVAMNATRAGRQLYLSLIHI